ncbi:MAG: hypothetical protein GX452_01575 [Ignavibacteriales bacterium]|nr:hypothetical protein [Ignavibacteriales bacterium]HOJ19207.1 hypothetical protein [Ignavibacteriaceae bacterium]
MKAKIVYFVLYLVVIAELLVVIHERDLLVESLTLDAIVKTAIQKLGVATNQPDNVYKVSFQEATPSSYTIFAPKLISETEKASVQFFAELDPASRNLFGANFFPDKLSSQTSDNKLKIYLTKDADQCKLTVQTFFLEVPGNVKGLLTGRRDVILKYYVYSKTPRILSDEIAPRNTEQLFEKLLQPTDKVRQDFKAEYGIDKREEQNKILKTIAARLFLGLEGERLANYVTKTGINPEFELSNSAVDEIVKKANEVLEKTASINEPVQKEKAFEEFKKEVYKNFKGKQNLGFSNEDDFYYEVSNKIPVIIRLSLF